jgi:uncharacterized membrane protein
MLTMRILLALSILIVLGQPAFAALNVCNKTAHDARVAVGRFDGTQWMSEGWWTIGSGKCASVVPERLKARYYYLYAVDGGSGVWDGSRNFCVGTADKWQAPGRTNCAGRGLDRKGFFAIDTGEKPDYTQTLSD